MVEGRGVEEEKKGQDGFVDEVAIVRKELYPGRLVLVLVREQHCSPWRRTC